MVFSMVRIVESNDEGTVAQKIDADDERFGQVFTIGTTGEDRDYVLENASVNIRTVGTVVGDLIVEIWTTDDQDPKEPLEMIATASIPKASVTAAFTWIETPEWDRKPTVRSGGSYAIILRTEGADVSNCYETQYVGAGSYTGGEMMSSLNAGLDWTPGGASDMRFRILGSKWDSVSADYATIVDKGGKEADVDIIDVDSINSFAANAESSLNARARFDFTGEWANLKPTFRRVISEQVENVSATRIINFAIDSYTDRLIAKLMVDTLIEEYERVLEDLKDKQIQKDMVA